jgi:hypothetical protein
MKSSETFKNFDEFWPHYVSEHKNMLNKRMHFLGLLIVHLIILYVFGTADFKMLLWVPIVGYSFSWLGHFIAEKNTPATFKYPLWSLRADFKMFYLTLFK